MAKKLYIETVGCQMNVLDSELVVGSAAPPGLRTDARGHRRRRDPLQHLQRPPARRGQDLQRPRPAARPQATPSRQGRRRARLHGPEGPGIDPPPRSARGHRLRHRPARSIAGTDRRGRANAARRNSPSASIARKARATRSNAASRATIRCAIRRCGPSPFQAYVRIMIGCDKFCTYCIVPSVRGPEQSRPPEHIAAEVRQLAAEGCKEVTLLGQTVNSYQYDLWRRPPRTPVRSAAAHPRHARHRAHQVHHQLPARHERRPARRRPRSAEGLRISARPGPIGLQRHAQAHEAAVHGRVLPRHAGTAAASACRAWRSAAISSSASAAKREESFERTCDLVREGGFKNSFIFKYSPRPGTKADELFADDVPEEVKKRRNNDLLAIQNARQPRRPSPPDRANGRGAGRGAEQERAKARSAAGPGPKQLTGRTMTDHIVVFEGNERLIGRTVQVQIEEATAFTLFGTVVTGERIGVTDREISALALPRQDESRNRLELPLV